MLMCTVVRMMCYTAFATMFLLGVATGQTSLEITSCLTKNQNLQMYCKFTPASDPKLTKTCYYKTDGKVIASTDSSMIPESTFKNRANISLVENTCKLSLIGFPEEKPQNYTCFIQQTTTPVSAFAILEKNKLQTCSGWCVVQHSGAALLLAILTFPLLSELL